MRNKLPPKERGKFRTVRVWVGNREGMPSEQIPSLVEDWIKKANSSLLNEKELHVEFEKIHPFIDGNGRMGRILMNWARAKTNHPIMVIYERNKFAYYEWFK